jgi:glutamate-1-semialdehyde aminotransferase
MELARQAHLKGSQPKTMGTTMIATASDKVTSFFTEIGLDSVQVDVDGELVIDYFDQWTNPRRSMRVTMCQCVIEDVAAAA